MNEINEADLRSLVRQLDETIPKQGAVVVESETAEGRTLIAGNRLGFLRLGVEFLKGAFAQPADEKFPNRIDVELEYLVGVEDVCYSFERREDIVPQREAEGQESFLRGLLGIATIIFVLASLLVGAFAILRWLWSLLAALI